MDAQVKERGPSAEQPRSPERSPPQESPREPNRNADQPREPTRKPSLRSRLRAHWLLVTAVVLVAVAALAGGCFYWLQTRDYESTDDAFIAARSFSVASKVGGYVTDVPVTDNEHVVAGDVLARIDERDYEAAVQQAQAQFAVAQANVANFEAQIEAQREQVKEARAQLDQANAQLQFAKQEAGRAQELAQRGAGTLQQQQQTRSNLLAQQANTQRAQTAVAAAEVGIKTLQAQLDGAQASLQQAQAQLDQAQLNLQHTTIAAAQPGRAVQISAAKGTFVTPGQSLMMFVPDDMWVVANFKETQLTDMRPGQPAEIRIDAYPGRKITGHVASVQPGSGTAFSLLPAENATGNYVKVVQRMPVKIVIDNWPSDLRIGPGMSVVPWVKVR